MVDEPVAAFDGMVTVELLAAMEGNMAAHMAYLPRFLPDATVLDDPDLVVIDAGVPSDTLNTICGANLDPATVDARIAAALDHFCAKNLPFTWWVGPVSRPADLDARLITHGLVETETEVGMALNLARLPVLPPLPDEIVIRRVTTVTELIHFAEVVAANWNPPDRAVIDFYARVWKAVIAPECPARHYVGYLDGKPVATSECFLSRGVAGLYGIVTLPRARRRGIGTAMTSAPLLDARAAGYRTATLQASAGGQSVYTRLGFLPCATFREYKPASAHR